MLVVADTGPGIAARSAEQAEQSERVGTSGLGLDIARRTATGCGGSLDVTSDEPAGTRVEVRLPLLPG